MFKFLDKLNIFRKKSASLVTLIQQSGRAVLTDWDLEKYAQEAYQKNYVAYTAIRDISIKCARIPLIVFNEKDEEIPDHPVLELLNKPNPFMGRSFLWESTFSYYLLTGNGFLVGIGPTRNPVPRELWPLIPFNVEIQTDQNGIPTEYVHRAGTKESRYPMLNGKSAVLHWRTFNPFDLFRGMPPLQAAAMAVDRHNESMRWNLSLLMNGAKPDGIFTVEVTENNPSGRLDPDQFKQLKKQVDENYTGSGNAGRPYLMEGGVKWQQMSISPKDMDWLEGTNMSARDIANALGYPPVLLGISGDSTYNNQKEARQSLYEDTVLPLNESFIDMLNAWLMPVYGDGAKIKQDTDSIEILQEKKFFQWERIDSAWDLTINEKRYLRGHEPIEGGDVIYQPTNVVPVIDNLPLEE